MRKPRKPYQFQKYLDAIKIKDVLIKMRARIGQWTAPLQSPRPPQAATWVGMDYPATDGVLGGGADAFIVWPDVEVHTRSARRPADSARATEPGWWYSARPWHAYEIVQPKTRTPSSYRCRTRYCGC